MDELHQPVDNVLVAMDIQPAYGGRSIGMIAAHCLREADGRAFRLIKRRALDDGVAFRPSQGRGPYLPHIVHCLASRFFVFAYPQKAGSKCPPSPEEESRLSAMARVGPLDPPGP